MAPFLIFSFFSSALDEAAAALTRMRAEPAAVAADQDTGRSLVAAACSEGDIGNFTIYFH